VPQDLIRTALDLELAEGTVIADRLGETDCVFLAGLYRAERAIAERLLALIKGSPPWVSIDPAKAACSGPATRAGYPSEHPDKNPAGRAHMAAARKIVRENLVLTPRQTTATARANVAPAGALARKRPPQAKTAR
jgi:hypothetical protein